MKAYFLGRLIIEAENGEVQFPTAKVRLLTAYLFWNQGQWVRRDLLRGMLWGESDEERAAANLRMALHMLRKALVSVGESSDLVEVCRDAIRIKNGVQIWVDAQIFEQEALKGLADSESSLTALTTAAALYRGDFLEDLDSEWVSRQRDRLSDLYVGVLRALVEQLQKNGLTEAAIGKARDWLALNPLDERPHQALMKLYSTTEQPHRVKEQFDDCYHIIQSELGTSPSEETIRLYEQLGGTMQSKPNLKRGAHRPYVKPQATIRNQIRLSSDPLRNARLLLEYANSKALQGESVSIVAAVETALAVYDHEGAHSAARARLILAEGLLNVVAKPYPTLARDLIQEALGYFRTNGEPGETAWALALAADAAILTNDLDQAIALAKEGLSLQKVMDTGRATIRLQIVLATALTITYRLAEAKELFERSGKLVPELADTMEVIGYIHQRGFCDLLSGEFTIAENLFKEALTVSSALALSELTTKNNEWVVRFHLMVAEYYLQKRERTEWVSPPNMLSKQLPEEFGQLVPLFTRKNGNNAVNVESITAWLRARSHDLPLRTKGLVLWLLVEQLISKGNFIQGAAWSAVGAREARRRGWLGWTAAFYGRRAVALANQGLFEQATVCCLRAEQSIDQGDNLTPAWIAWARGLVAYSGADQITALAFLSHAADSFKKFGDEFDANRVLTDISAISTVEEPTTTDAKEMLNTVNDNTIERSQNRSRNNLIDFGRIAKTRCQ